MFQFISFSQTTSEVNHSLDWHPTLNTLIAAVQLGVSLLNQSHPELIWIGTASITVGAILLW